MQKRFDLKVPNFANSKFLTKKLGHFIFRWGHFYTKAISFKFILGSKVRRVLEDNYSSLRKSIRNLSRRYHYNYTIVTFYTDATFYIKIKFILYFNFFNQKGDFKSNFIFIFSIPPPAASPDALKK